MLPFRHLVLLTLVGLSFAAHLEAANRGGDSDNHDEHFEPEEDHFESDKREPEQSGDSKKNNKGLGNLFGGSVLSSLLGAKKEAPPSDKTKPEETSSKSNENGSGKSKGDAIGLVGPLKLAGELSKGEDKPSGPFGLSLDPLKSISDLTKLAFNPLELVKSISSKFSLPLDKLIEKLGAGLVVGVEALLHPIVATIKIVEKVFVPDTCRLRFFCQMGSHLNFIRETVLKFSPSLLEGSSQVRALTSGIKGDSCETAFKDCELSLNKPFAALAGLGSSPSASSGSKSSGEEGKGLNKLAGGLFGAFL